MNKYKIQRWEDSLRTYDCIDKETQEIMYSGSLQECHAFIKGLDNHQKWNTQDWVEAPMFHLPELNDKEDFYGYEFNKQTNWLF